MEEVILIKSKIFLVVHLIKDCKIDQSILDQAYFPQLEKVSLNCPPINVKFSCDLLQLFINSTILLISTSPRSVCRATFRLYTSELQGNCDRSILSFRRFSTAFELIQSIDFSNFLPPRFDQCLAELLKQFYKIQCVQILYFQ